MAAPTPPGTDILSQLGRLFSFQALAIGAADLASGVAGTPNAQWRVYVSHGVVPRALALFPAPAAVAPAPCAAAAAAPPPSPFPTYGMFQPGGGGSAAGQALGIRSGETGGQTF